MRPIGTLLLACLISLLGYFTLFAFVLSKPLTIDIIRPMLEKKLAYAARARGPKIWIIAGSNARFSHSCAVLEQELRRPCVNLGIAGSVRTDWVIAQAGSLIRRGDLIYMPLEYDFYTSSRANYLSGQDAAYRFRHERLGLLERGWEGVVRAAFMFDLSSLLQSIGEMGLSAGGVTRRYNLATMDAQGDEIGHGDAKAKAYEAYLRSSRFKPVTAARFDSAPDGGQVFLARFLDWAHTRDVVVVGGLPTTFADVQIEPAIDARIRALFLKHGAAFVVLPDHSRFPRSAFYDTPYHLRDRGQMNHSHQLAAALRPFLPPTR